MLEDNMAPDLPDIDGFWYLGSPYSKYPDGLHAAFVEACRASALLIAAGHKVYSPIAHTHPVAMYGEMDPLDHAIWLPADKPMMDAAGGLIVLKMKTWEDSYGLAHEVEAFEALGKPAIHMEWND